MNPRRLPRSLDSLVTAGVLVVAALCLWYAAERVILLMHDVPFDHAIFAAAGHAFWQSGQFYPHVAEPYPTFLPGAAVFKFPPVYQLYIAPWVHDGVTPAYYRNSYVVCLLVYAAGVLLLCRYALRALHSSSRNVRLCFTGLVLAIACVFEPFYSGFLLLVGEIPIFFCCVLALVLLKKKPALAGAVLAVAASAKLYPVFMVLCAVILPTHRARAALVTGFVAAAAALWLLTLLLFGWQEPLYYLTHILPVLLDEHPMGITENLSLVFFLFPDGITHTFASNVFLLIRVLTLGLLAWVMRVYLQQRRHNHNTVSLQNHDSLQNNDALMYGLLITSMIICLANYWIQYEVLLLIPATLVLATSLQRHHAVMSCVAALLWLLLLSSNELDDNLLLAYAQEPLATLATKAEQQGVVPTLWATSRTAFLFAVIAPLKPLAPYGLWLASARLLLQAPPVKA